MTIYTIYFSPTHTTRKIIRSIAQGFNMPYSEIDLTLKKNRNTLKPITFDSDDLVIAGVPVYAGRIPEITENMFRKFKGANTPAIPVVVYGNRDYDDALLELKDLLNSLGFNSIAAGAFIGEHSYTNKVAGGRPDQNDSRKASQFGQECLQLTKQIANFNSARLQIKGNFPYKERHASAPMTPTANSDCTNCGLCAASCPVEAIDPDDCTTTNAHDCIRCCACIKNCPQQAKSFDNEAINTIRNRLITNCSTLRKEPELFFAQV